MKNGAGRFLIVDHCIGLPEALLAPWDNQDVTHCNVSPSQLLPIS